MSPAPITRRALVAAAGAVLGAATLPTGISAAPAGGTPPVGLPGPVPLAFDPRAYVADLRANGLSVAAVERGACPMYGIGPGADGRFNSRGHHAVMARWSGAMDACPDHAARVVAHLDEQVGRDAP